MNFTDREIELAKQLHSSGLEWKPQGGDWYIDKDGEIILLTGMTIDLWRQYESLPIKNKIWLPLWHQCRQLISDADLYILLLTKKDDIQIDIWQYDSGHKTSQGQYLGLIRGETDLEAMYQVIDTKCPIGG